MSIENKAHVVGDAWMLIRKSSEWDEVVKYGDVGFPLAYAVDNDLASIEDRGEKYIEEVYDLLINILQIPEDEFYENFEAMLDRNIELFKDEKPEEKEG